MWDAQKELTVVEMNAFLMDVLELIKTMFAQAVSQSLKKLLVIDARERLVLKEEA